MYRSPLSIFQTMANLSPDALKVMLGDKDHPARIVGGNSVEKRGYLQANEAAQNPESWTFFAMAVHLTHENPGFSFTSTISKKRES